MWKQVWPVFNELLAFVVFLLCLIAGLSGIPVDPDCALWIILGCAISHTLRYDWGISDGKEESKKEQKSPTACP